MAEAKVLGGSFQPRAAQKLIRTEPLSVLSTSPCCLTLMLDAAPTIYTIGHGRHAWADFLALLTEHKIALVADVRSAARSRWPQFNGRVLKANLREARIGYDTDEVMRDEKSDES